MSRETSISERGASWVPQAPKFFDVLDDLWDPATNPSGIVNLGLAENVLMQTELAGFINSKSHITSHALTYGDGFTGSKRLKEALCLFLNQHLLPVSPLLPAHLFATPGVGNALECCAWSLFDAGDVVLVGRPYWTAFDYIFKIRAQVEVRQVSFGNVSPFSLEGLAEYEKEYARATEEGKTVKAVLLCSPHNPLGRCYPAEVLKAYMRLCGRLDLHLIADEIYAFSVFANPELPDAVPFTSVLSLHAGEYMDPRKVHVQWGLSKDFGATGLRVGCLISQSNPQFLKSLESFSLFNFPSSLADNLTVSLLNDRDFLQNYIATYQSRLSKSYRHVAKALREVQIPYRNSNAALFMMVNFGDFGKARHLTDQETTSLLRRHGVYITSGQSYKEETAGWFRLVIAHPIHVLDEGLRRIIEALG